MSSRVTREEILYLLEGYVSYTGKHTTELKLFLVE